MSDSLVVRRVGGVDLRPAVELLVHQLRAHGRGPGQAMSAEQLRPAVQAMLEDSDRTLMIGAFHEGLPGFAHGKMVGVLLMNVFFSLEHAGEAGWIEELFVREDYRRRGLANRLLDQALDWARGRGVRSIDLEVGDGHEPTAAQHLYARRGFERIQRSRLSLRLQ
jgi:GNAT superfamily N-acetyltransferase